MLPSSTPDLHRTEQVLESQQSDATSAFLWRDSPEFYRPGDARSSELAPLFTSSLCSSQHSLARQSREPTPSLLQLLRPFQVMEIAPPLIPIGSTRPSSPGNGCPLFCGWPPLPRTDPGEAARKVALILSWMAFQGPSKSGMLCSSNKDCLPRVLQTIEDVSLSYTGGLPRA